MAVSHSLEKGGDAIVGNGFWAKALRIFVCVAVMLYILTIKAC